MWLRRSVNLSRERQNKICLQSNPERQAPERHLQDMMSPQMMEMMKGMDFNQEKVNAQFQQLGLKPEDVISKVGFPWCAVLPILMRDCVLLAHCAA